MKFNANTDLFSEKVPWRFHDSPHASGRKPLLYIYSLEWILDLLIGRPHFIHASGPRYKVGSKSESANSESWSQWIKEIFQSPLLFVIYIFIWSCIEMMMYVVWKLF
jgi:hypothetical protein